MNKIRNIEETSCQGFGYPEIAVLVTPPEGTYYQTESYGGSTNNTTSETVVEDILKRYFSAWKTLADL